MTLWQETRVKASSLKVRLLTDQTIVLRHDTYMGITNHTRVDEFNYCRSLTSVWTFVKDWFSHLRANHAILAFRCWLSKKEKGKTYVCRPNPNPKQFHHPQFNCVFNRFLIKCLKLNLCFCRFYEGQFMTF